MVKHAGSQTANIQAMGKGMAKAFPVATKTLTFLSIGATIANYNAGNISGIHATVNITMNIVGMFFSAVGLAYNLVDAFFGNSIFNDGKQ